MHLISPIYQEIKKIGRSWKIRKAKRIFEHASKEPAWLGITDLELLQKKYSFIPEWSYDPATLETRGQKRASEILGLIPKRSENTQNFLELGCRDGMVSLALQRMGKKLTAIDWRDNRFDKRALKEGLKLIKMDASQLQFTNDSFDFIFSYASFEHFKRPDVVLQEAVRVVRKGGHIFFRFSPLYMSPYGLHAHRSITVPYCQILFSKETLSDFVRTNNLKPINFDSVNGWSLQSYRALWDRCSAQLKRLIYDEWCNYDHLDLIEKYPSCFKSKTECFEDLLVSGIKVLFKKK